MHPRVESFGPEAFAEPEAAPVVVPSSTPSQKPKNKRYKIFKVSGDMLSSRAAALALDANLDVEVVPITDLGPFLAGEGPPWLRGVPTMVDTDDKTVMYGSQLFDFLRPLADAHGDTVYKAS